MALALVTAPTKEPLLVSEIKTQLRIDHASEDDLLASYLVSARLYLEGRYGWLGRVFLTQTWDESFDAFPATFRLTLAPVQSITSITYLDTAGASVVLAASLYRTDLVSEPARITPAYGTTWPSTYDVTNAVTVRYVAGWTSAAGVPEPAKLALMLLIGHFYSHREGGEGPDAELDRALDRLLRPLRISSGVA